MDLVEIFGNHIYKNVQDRPKRTLRELTFIYSAAGTALKYFAPREMLPARKYMQWATSESAITPLRHPERSALVSLYLPCEILHAAGISQMFPEALACYLAAAKSERAFIETAERNGVPRTLCSYHKAFMGLMESGVLPRPKMIINTSLACDVNHLSFMRAEEFYGVPRFMIDVPYEYNERNLDQLTARLRDMKSFVEQNTGRPVDEAGLKEATDRSRETLRNFRRIVELRRDRYIPDEMTSNMLSLFGTHVMLGTGEALKYSRDLLRQLEKRPPERKGVRLLWVHTLPYWQDSLKQIMNFTDRVEIAACDITLDALHIDLDQEDPYRFMAERLIRNTSNGPGMNRAEAALNYARALDADGVVWFCHWGCKQTAGSSAMAREYLEKNGFPTLILDGDGCDHQNVNDSQTVTRMEAFLELLESKK